MSFRTGIRARCRDFFHPGAAMVMGITERRQSEHSNRVFIPVDILSRTQPFDYDIFFGKIIVEPHVVIFRNQFYAQEQILIQTKKRNRGSRIVEHERRVVQHVILAVFITQQNILTIGG